MNVEQIRHVGVIGAGTMGNGIAQVFAAAGYRVSMADISQQALDAGMRGISGSLDRLLAKSVISDAERDRTLENIQPCLTLSCLESADFVVEAATESLETKSSLLQEIDGICPPETVIASNTSSISLTRLAACTGRPDRVVGMHFMNPVPVMKLVEIIRALQTDDEVCALSEALAVRLGKVPFHVNDSPGFVANRILCPMINEAVFALQEGIAEPAAIDEIMKLGMNHPIGPLALADLIGLDVVLAVMRVLHDEMGESKFRPCPLLVRMVDANHLGRKTGKGFYDYDK